MVATVEGLEPTGMGTDIFRKIVTELLTSNTSTFDRDRLIASSHFQKREDPLGISASWSLVFSIVF